jgi:uroporphyrinogen-III synthase
MSQKPISIQSGKELPLAGWRILVTRASRQSVGLSYPLRELGAEVIEVPTIEIRPPQSFAALDQALVRIDHYDTLILTSVNGVETLFERYNRMGLPVVDMQHLLVVAIGPATAAAIQSEGVSVSIVPEKYVAESVVEALRGKITQQSRVLLVRARIARDVLPDELRKMGAQVEVIEAYETAVPENAAARLKEVFADQEMQPHVVTFTSSSTATNFLALLGEERDRMLEGVKLASIGPVTTATLKQAGLKPDIEASEYTMAGLVGAIADFVSATRQAAK